MKTFRTIGTGSEQTISEIETDKIPLYPTEQDLLDDLANLEVGQIAGTIDPAESELIGVLIQRIQALESKLESDDVYSTDEVKTNKKIIINGVWKDVYRKVCPYANTITISNLEQMVNIQPIYANGELWCGLYYYNSSNHDSISINGDTITPQRAGNTGAISYYIFEYTKTSA